LCGGATYVILAEMENLFSVKMCSEGAKQMTKALFKRAYKYQRYPTKKQAEKLLRGYASERPQL
jgi:hypothetical protein